MDSEEPVDSRGREASVNSPMYVPVSFERVLSRNLALTPGMTTHRPRLSASLPLHLNYLASPARTRAVPIV
ncbi:hypothetical protein BGY98DRAFT_1043483, partial [Russula aff. rugulosa BPL654]